LKPQAGHRQTACMRYISAAPHRSQSTLSSAAGFDDVDVVEEMAVVGREEGRSGLSGIGRDYRIFPKVRKLDSIKSLRFVSNPDNSEARVLTCCAQ